ncbi:MAG TPA: BT4734/BF3469 family protein [Candidatus Saccharimonadia bacterium]|nr:BT4734/BF3469 family protein [Candidatus Saccharimonadia bacterium]
MQTSGTVVARLGRLQWGLLATDGKARYDKAKRDSMAFTPGGVFAPKRANVHLTTPSGLLNFNFDHPPNLAAAKASLTADPYVVYAFISPSGDGLKMARCLFHKYTASSPRVFPGSATLQRGFQSRAGARRSQEDTGVGLTKWTSRAISYFQKESRHGCAYDGF